METVRGKLENMLSAMGMLDSQTKKVLDISIPKMNDIVEDYNISWNSCSSEYPEAIYTVLFMTVKVDAKEWIAEHNPEAWFRPLFDSSLIEEELY